MTICWVLFSFYLQENEVVGVFSSPEKAGHALRLAREAVKVRNHPDRMSFHVEPYHVDPSKVIFSAYEAEVVDLEKPTEKPKSKMCFDCHYYKIQRFGGCITEICTHPLNKKMADAEDYWPRRYGGCGRMGEWWWPKRKP